VKKNPKVNRAWLVSSLLKKLNVFTMNWLMKKDRMAEVTRAIKSLLREL
jgi:hypothetical protein